MFGAGDQEQRHHRLAQKTVRAKLRTLVRRKLRQRGDPPDLQEKAVETVIRQAELLATAWT